MAIPRTNGRDSDERRRGRRFPIRQAIQYKVLRRGAAVLHGTGTTLDFSMSGIQFTTETELSIGSTIEVSVEWPALLNGNCGLKFVGTGQVVRSEGNRASVKIQHHEFRTRGKSAQQRDQPTDAPQPGA